MFCAKQSREIKIAKPWDMGFCDGSVTAITETRLFLRHLPREISRKSHVSKATDVCSHCCWDRSSSHSRDVVLGASDGGWDQFALMRLAQATLARPTEPTRLASRLRRNQEWSRHLIVKLPPLLRYLSKVSSRDQLTSFFCRRLIGARTKRGEYRQAAGAASSPLRSYRTPTPYLTWS